MNEFFPNPFWQALTTAHASFAVGSQLARRYPASVAPFGGLAQANTEAMAALRDTLDPGEVLYLTGEDFPECPGLEKLGSLPGWQMLFTAALPGEQHGEPAITQLSAADAPEMVALTEVAFPGYFRSETYRMGPYYGIRADGALVSMSGGRIALPGIQEVSAVCTHPDHTGRGYAARLIQHFVRTQAAAGLRTFLHVASANQRAIPIYQRLGFVRTGDVLFNKFRRTNE